MVGTNEVFEERGYGAGRIEPGTRPAVLVVDFQRAFTRPELPFGGGDHVRDAVGNTARLLSVARELGVPVIQTVVAYRDDGADLGLWRSKVPALGEITTASDHARVDEDLFDPSDLVFVKKMPSAFFGTPVARTLVEAGCDTVIVCGCTTSGCVRATVVDSFSHGFRTLVPADCCGDQDAASHEANLGDVGRRYAEVVNSEEVIQYLKGLPR